MPCSWSPVSIDQTGPAGMPKTYFTPWSFRILAITLPPLRRYGYLVRSAILVPLLVGFGLLHFAGMQARGIFRGVWSRWWRGWQRYSHLAFFLLEFAMAGQFTA